MTEYYSSSLDHVPNIKSRHNIFLADKAGIAAPKCASFLNNKYSRSLS